MPNTDNATEMTLQLYSVPQRIQARALDLLQEKVLDGKEMVDGNNPATFLMEFSATVAAGIVNEVSQSLSTLYPSRAQTIADLYRHMSDYDYVNLFSTPSNTTIEVVLNRDYLIQNAVRYGNTDYKKIVIPEYSTFKIGEYTFGIYYPIEIQIRESRSNGVIDYDNCLISTQWDLSTENPLMSIETNILENRTYTRDGITMLCITIPIYQFSIDRHQEDAIATTGFSKRYTYNDKFYAARIFHYFEGAWHELAQTLSDVVYDPMVATVKLSVYTDINTLQVDIPQVYFTNNLIGSKIKTYLYTSKGALDVDISEYNADQFSASFLLNDEVVNDTYSSMLKRIPYCQVLPIAKRISSGSDGLTFEEMRERVVHDSTYTLLITPTDITNYFSDQGFIAKRYLDNLTNRIYLAQKVMTDSAGVTISAGDQVAVFQSTVFHHETNEDTGEVEITNYRTIKYINDRSFMILPTTVYQYDQNTNTVVPMDNKWMDALEDMSAAEKIALLNNNVFTYTPFHLKLTTTNSTPVACYYDLLQPKITHTTFVSENTNVTSQISIYNSSITHLDNGTGGYRFYISLYKTSDMQKVSALGEDGLTPNITVVLKTTTSDGQSLYMYGQYAGQYQEHDVFVFDFHTSYKIDEDGEIDISSFKSMSSGLQTTAMVPLSNEYKIMFFVGRSFISSPTASVGVDSSQFPPDLEAGSVVWLATQQFTLELGEALNSLFTNVSVHVEQQQYQTYPTTVYATYTGPVYARYTEADVGSVSSYYGTITIDHVGILKYPLELIHDEGEVILSPVYDETIPPACTIKVPKVEEEGVDTFKMYLQPIYTATSSPTNVWLPPSEGFKDYDPNNHYKIEVVDVMKFAIDDITNHNGTVDTFDDLRIQFHDVEVENEDGTVSIERATFDPYIGQMFLFVRDISDDLSDPENTFSLGDGGASATTGALYRRNTEYTSFDYSAYQYRLATDTEYHTLTAEVLEQIYNDLDANSGNLQFIQTKYNMTASVVRKLANEIRRPWIKVINASSMDQITTYWNNRRIVNTTADVLFDIQSHLSRVAEYGSYEALIEVEDTIEIGAIVWVADVSSQKDSMPDRLIGDLDVSALQTQGALLRKQEESWEWIITGPNKRNCVAHVNATNTFSGFAYLISLNDQPKYLNLLSYDDTVLNINFDTYTWGEIDHWPWEITSAWVDITTCVNSGVDLDIDKNTSAKISQYGGDVQLDENGNLIGVITDSNGDPVEEDDDYADTRQITYNVRTLQVDYKLTYSTETQHVTYRNDILELLRSYFNTINTARASLLERTEFYYAPIRTMGYAEFKGTNAEVESRSLDITMGFRLYVQDYVANSADNKDAIMNNVLSIIDSHLATGSISTTRLAEEIRESLSDTVQYVENLGINGDPELRILILNESMEECIPHLKQELYLDEANQIKVNRGVTLEYVSID